MGNYCSTKQILEEISTLKTVKNYEYITESFMTENWSSLNNTQCLEHLSNNFCRYNISETFLEKTMTSPWNWRILSKVVMQ